MLECLLSMLSHLKDLATCPATRGFLLVVGALVTIYKVVKVIRFLFAVFVIPGKSLQHFGPKGTWALVTGASDGIGKEFATQLASSGYNVVLVSRTLSKLQTVQKEIEASHPGIRTVAHAMDFAQNNDEDYVKLEELISKLEISILINNVGVSHDIPVPFTSTPDPELQSIISVNCMSTLRITKLVVPSMVTRKRGLVMTMGSIAGVLPSPLLATYSASKAFLQHWSTALAGELEPHGVTVEFVQSYFVVSKMSRARQATWSIPTPRDFVKTTLRKLGRESGSTYAYTSSPWWSHALFVYVLTDVMGAMAHLQIPINKKMHESIRARALRKRQKVQ